MKRLVDRAVVHRSGAGGGGAGGRRIGLIAVACFAVVLVAAGVWAQQLPAGVRVGGGFSAPIHDEQGRLKYLVEGREAKPHLTKGQLLVVPFRLKAFRASGELEIEVEAPECTFDYATAFSSSNLTVRGGGGAFVIRGRGFLWQQTNATLAISNDVVASLQRQLVRTEAATATAAGVSAPGAGSAGGAPITIRARSMEYDSRAMTVIFREEVAASDDRGLALRCGKLSSQLPPPGGRIERIRAEGNVTIEVTRDGLPVTGKSERALYALGVDGGDVMTLEGSPSWRAQGFEGEAAVLRFQAVSNAFVFRGSGSGRVRAPRSVLARPGPGGSTLEAAGNAARGVVPGQVEIQSDEYEMRPGQALFTGRVRVDHRPDWVLGCERLTMGLRTPVLAVDSIVGEGKVVIELGETAGGGRARAGVARYRFLETGGPTLELEENPSWVTPRYEGTARLLRLHLETQEFQALGEARFRLLPVPAGAPEPGRASSAAGPGARQPLEIRSTRYAFNRSRGTFEEGVCALYERWDLRCRDSVVHFGARGDQIDRIVAQGEVRLRERGKEFEGGAPSDAARAFQLACERMTFIMAEGRSNEVDRVEMERDVVFTDAAGRATSQRGVYRALEGMLQLSDEPRLETWDGKRLSAPVMRYDRTTRRFEAEGPYRAELPGATVKSLRRNP